MPTALIVNDFQTTMSSSATNTATSLSVAAAISGAGGSDIVYVRNQRTGEIVKVTSGANTTTWTVTREAEDASRWPKAAMNSGDVMEVVASKQALIEGLEPLAIRNGSGGSVVCASTGEVTISGIVVYAVISPTQLTGNTNDWNPTSFITAELLRINASTAINITGMVPPKNQCVWSMLNVNTNNITLKHESASSAAANRFNFPGGTDIVLAVHDCITIWNDSTSGRLKKLE